MNDTLLMIFAFIAGLALGALFFGGLWLTVKKTITAKTPVVWVLGSFFLRVSIVLIGFYFISNGSWQRLMICLAGFIAARFIVTYLTKPVKKEVFHET